MAALGPTETIYKKLVSLSEAHALYEEKHQHTTKPVFFCVIRYAITPKKILANPFFGIPEEWGLFGFRELRSGDCFGSFSSLPQEGR